VVKKYKLMRVPIEAFRGFEEKKEKMEKRIKVWTGRDTNIPMTKVLTAIATNPVEISEDQIIRLHKKRVRRVKIIYL
jgi:hypothetical protein